MNQLGRSLLFTDMQAHIDVSGQMLVTALAIKRTLIGSLTIHGLAAADGRPLGEWVLPAGTPRGCYEVPGSGGGRLLSYEFSNAADGGAAVIAFAPK